MKSHSSGRQGGEKTLQRQSAGLRQGNGREAAGVQMAPGMQTFYPMQLMQLQQTIGNLATGAVIQRMLDPSTGNRFPVDWRNLNLHQLQMLEQHVANGSLIYEPGDQDALNKRKLQLQTGSMDEEEEEVEIEEEADEIDEISEIDSDSEEEEESSSEDEMEAMNVEEWYEQDISSQGTSDDEEFKPGVNPIVQELYSAMEPKFKQSVEDRGGKKLPGKKVQGDFLEQYVTSHSRDMDTRERDANQFAMNIPGIDHMMDSSSHPFVQDKMHLSAHTAKIETYRAHYAKRFDMAKKLLKSMAEEGKRGTSIRGMFESVVSDDAWIHKNAVEPILSEVNKHRELYKKALTDDTADSLPDILDNDGLIQQVGNCIAFAVPSDIWEQLYAASERGEVLPAELRSYIRLDLDTGEFRQLYDMLSHVAAPWNERKPKQEDDEYKG
ncbi:hypothetical protein [Paenibacillus soyae]|uniref:Uncharacterized protein n=1 Tax=Paenibacillus soyae TaxID=2969249 RepID=A0A9X2SA16_9BACL|nr:hypothetical protein [Paenibacillus soyae]MCR2805625.1 hypothetical protein [Paenibacillus soyae]